MSEWIYVRHGRGTNRIVRSDNFRKCKSIYSRRIVCEKKCQRQETMATVYHSNIDTAIAIAIDIDFDIGSLFGGFLNLEWTLE